MYIAVLEDDSDQADLLKSVLESADHTCRVFDAGERLLRSIGHDTFDLLIIDWMLPDIPGDEVLRRVRERLDWELPVLFVTQRDSEEDVVKALESGADDYMAKPVKPRELLARVGALGRRGQQASLSEDTFEAGPLRFNLSDRAVYLDGERVSLTDTEYRLASLLFQNPGRLFSRSHILETVWGRSPDIDTRTVDVHVSRLRRKLRLADIPGFTLKSVYQQGYRLESVAKDG